MARRPARADLYVVRDEWIKYVAGEVAHIENLLPGETKERKLVNLTETEQTTTTDQEKSTITERDSQTTDRFDLHDEASRDTNLAVHIDGKVDTSGQYGPTTVTTHIGGDLNYSQEQSQKHATTQATETVARAVTKVEERYGQVRTVRSLTRTTETDRHSLTNADKEKPIVGVYRWVEKIQRVQIFRYRNRFLLEFEIPEPGAWWRWLEDQGKNKGLLTEDPIPLTINGKEESADNPRIQASDITDDAESHTSYLTLGARYASLGLIPSPKNQVVAVAFKRDSVDKPASAPEEQSIRFATEATMTVPDGYQAKDWIAFVHSFPAIAFMGDGCSIDICVGGGDPDLKKAELGGGGPLGQSMTGDVGKITQGVIPVAVMSVGATGFAIDINVQCVPTEEALEKWRINAYDQILQAYFCAEATAR